MALPPEARAPKKRKVRKKKPAYHPPSNFHTDTTSDRRPTPKAGPPSPQRTGKPRTPQPVTRKKNAAPTTTDTTSSANRSPSQKAKDRKAVARNVAEARRKVVRKRGKGAIVRQAKKELEGRGALANVFGKLGKDINKKGILVSTGAGPSVGVPKAKGSGVATALAPTHVKVKGTAVGRTLQDIANLPAQALPSVYVPAAGAVEAAQGRPERIKKFVKDIDEHDPVYNAGAALVEAAGGDSKSAKKRLDRAKKSVEEHPGFAAAELYGVKGVVGRGAGSVARSGVAGKRAKAAASTERADRTVPGTAVTERRKYSRDVTQKVGQVAVEKVKRRSAERLRRKAEVAPEDEAVALREKAARRDPDRVPEREIERRVDERMAVNEDVRRMHRADITNKARKITKSVEREGHATPVVAQRIAKADRTDLGNYVRELEKEFPGLSPSGKRANKTLRKRLQKVIDDPKADLSKVETAARQYEELLRPVQRKLVKKGLLGEGQEARAKMIPYAVRNMGAKHDPEHWVDSAGDRVSRGDVLRAQREDPTAAREEYTHVPARLVDKKGAELPDKAILAHMKKNGVEEPAFITQAPNQRGSRNFNVRNERAVTINTGRRTGEATRKGTFDADPEVLVEGAARAQGLVDATRGFRKTIKEFAVRGDNQKVRTFKSYKDAQQAARDLAHDHNGDPVPGAVALRPVQLNPFGAKREQLDRLLEDVDSLDQGQAEALLESMREGVTSAKGDGPWALIPDVAARRIQEHLDAQGGKAGRKVFQLGNQAFRKTVLATSTTWAAGNFIEGLFRGGLAKAGPKSYLRGKAALGDLKEMDPKAYEEAMSRLVNGGHFASVDRTSIRRGAQQFEGTKLAPIANALGKFWRAPGPKHAAELWNRWTDFVFNEVNGRFETTVQTAMLGRALKDAGMKASEEAARGLRETPNQVRFAREIDRMFGRYSKRSPAEKYWMATYTPFAMWAINAAFFVYRTLPRDHPLTTTVIAAAENATEEWRKDEGLDLFIKGALPGFLQGSIPTGKGRHQRISRYTPFGAFGSPGETIAGQFNPLFTGALSALKGKDWKGQDLTVKDDDGTERKANELERFAAAARSMVEATVPVVSQAQRVKEQGPGALNPFRDVQPPKKKLRSSSSTAGRIVGGGSGAGKIVGPGTGAGKIVP